MMMAGCGVCIVEVILVIVMLLLVLVREIACRGGRTDVGRQSREHVSGEMEMDGW